MTDQINQKKIAHFSMINLADCDLLIFLIDQNQEVLTANTISMVTMNNGCYGNRKLMVSMATIGTL